MNGMEGSGDVWSRMHGWTDMNTKTFREYDAMPGIFVAFFLVIGTMPSGERW